MRPSRNIASSPCDGLKLDIFAHDLCHQFLSRESPERVSAKFLTYVADIQNRPHRCEYLHFLLKVRAALHEVIVSVRKPLMADQRSNHFRVSVRVGHTLHPSVETHPKVHEGRKFGALIDIGINQFTGEISSFWIKSSEVIEVNQGKHLLRRFTGFDRTLPNLGGRVYICHRYEMMSCFEFQVEEIVADFGHEKFNTKKGCEFIKKYISVFFFSYLKTFIWCCHGASLALLRIWFSKRVYPKLWWYWELIVVAGN